MKKIIIILAFFGNLSTIYAADYCLTFGNPVAEGSKYRWRYCITSTVSMEASIGIFRNNTNPTNLQAIIGGAGSNIFEGTFLFPTNNASDIVLLDRGDDYGVYQDNTVILLNGAPTCPGAPACSSSLPVSLTQFQAQNTEGGNLLQWQTAEEIDFSHYEIERSDTGEKFEKIDIVKAKGSNSTYPYLDKKPSSTKTYYRLKMVDIDGTFEYSKIVSVVGKIKGFSTKVYPNPFKGNATIEITSAEKTNVSIEIFDMVGKQVKYFKVDNTEGVTTLPLPLDDLISGAYVLKISNHSKVIQHKIIRQ
jgi:hypothetical protein